MPHILALFPENPEIRSFLREHKSRIRTIIAEVLGYPADDVALFSNPISPENLELADNLLPLEFIVNSGTRTLDREDECAETIRQRIIEKCPAADDINFGVWVISHGKNEFIEHKPRQIPEGIWPSQR